MKVAHSAATPAAASRICIKPVLFDGSVDDRKESIYQYVICFCSIISIISLLILCSVVPSMYNYVSNVSEFGRKDFSNCEAASMDIQKEMNQIQERFKVENRTKRHSNYGGYNPTMLAANALVFQECPACCIPGDRGPTGDSGLPGMPGNPGPDGAPGRPGTTPNASCIPERIFEPPPCLPCPQGPRGVPGHPGFPGDPGDPGISGAPGPDGDFGKKGDDGPQGEPGEPGPVGPPGDQGLTPESRLTPGPPGDPGEPGPWGPPGHPGSPGENGMPGMQGEKGYPGPPGRSGPIGPSGQPGPQGEPGPIGTPGTCVCQDTEVVVADQAGQNPAPHPYSTSTPSSSYGNEEAPTIGRHSQGGYDASVPGEQETNSRSGYYN